MRLSDGHLNQPRPRNLSERRRRARRAFGKVRMHEPEGTTSCLIDATRWVEVMFLEEPSIRSICVSALHQLRTTEAEKAAALLLARRRGKPASAAAGYPCATRRSARQVDNAAGNRGDLQDDQQSELGLEA